LFNLSSTFDINCIFGYLPISIFIFLILERFCPLCDPSEELFGDRDASLLLLAALQIIINIHIINLKQKNLDSVFSEGQ
jgi:hypothetical protein